LFPLDEGFGEPWLPRSWVQMISLCDLMLWGRFGLGRCTVIGAVLEPIAASGDGDHFGVVEQSIEDGVGGRHVAKELSPWTMIVFPPSAPG
jgi:hypothetical protein